MESVRDNILGRLKSAPAGEPVAVPELLPFPEMEMTQETLIETFTQRVSEQSGVVHRVKDPDMFREKLEHVVLEEKISELAVSDDLPDAITMDGIVGLTIKKRSDFTDAESFKDFLFTEADAGITGADYAVAESGTLLIAHDKKSPRLVSLAPVTHIAVVMAENLVPVYEPAVESVFREGKPSQMTLITGPSMTADIQATPFRGMHGPKRLIVFLVG